MTMNNGKEVFLEKYDKLTEPQIQLELLYAQKRLVYKLEKIRNNLNWILRLLAAGIALFLFAIIL